MKTIIITALLISVALGIVAKPNHEKIQPYISFTDRTDTEDKVHESNRPKPTATPKFKRKLAMVLPSQKEVAQKVREVFTEEPEIALAVFRAESGLRPDAQGWNCRYNGKSQACKPQDRAQAWSVDCGVAQINTPGSVCPEHLYDVETNLIEAHKKYVRRGWQPWVAHNQGKHLAFLEN